MSPVGKREVRAYEELIEAEFLAADRLADRRPDLVEHRPAWCEGIAATLREADLVLAVNEAASNVIDHAYQAPTDRAVVELFLWTEPGAVVLEIVDHGHWRPPDPGTTGRGRGIAIMQRLVEAVLIHHDAHGTRVLLRHSLPGHARTIAPLSRAERRNTLNSVHESGGAKGRPGRRGE